MKKLEITATIGTMIGYLLVSQQIMLAGLIVSLVASTLWIIWAKFQTIACNGLLIVNGFLVGCGILGLINL
jgi:hypothetical protein